MTPLFLLWQVSGSEDQPPEVDGSGLLITRRRRRMEPPAVRPLDSYRTPEDIRREQLETERYLASLEKPQQVPHKGRARDQAVEVEPVAASPILADVAARAASAVQAKLEEAAQAATADRLADDNRRRTLALLLALD